MNVTRAVVTGAAGGIGAALAARLREAGTPVVLSDVDAAALARTAAGLGATGRPGHVLITASLAGLATFPAGGAYPASEHAVIAVAEQAALALAGTPVGVTVLCPALVRTGMSAEGEDPGQG